MADPLEDFLRRSPLTQSQKADIWDAYNSAPDQDALTAALQPLQVPKEVKAGLWDLKAQSPAPEAPKAPPRQLSTGEMLKTALKGAITDRMQVDIGGAKGALSTVIGLGQMAHRTGQVMDPRNFTPGSGRMGQTPAADPSFEQARGEFATPEGGAQTVGFAGEQVAEFFVPGAAGGKVATAGKLARLARPAVEAGAVRAAQTGGDPSQTAMAAALGLVAPPVARTAKGPVMALARMAANNPVKNAIMSAAPDIYAGNYKTAAVEGALAYLGLKGGQKIPVAFAIRKALKGGATMEEAIAMVLGGKAQTAVAEAFPATMSKAKFTQMHQELMSSGKPEEARRLIEAMRSKAVRLVDDAIPAAQAASRMPLEPPRVPSGVVPEPGNTKMATIYQPEGTHFTTQHPEGAAQAGKVSPQSAALVDDQLRLIAEAGGEANPLIAPEAQSAIKAKPKDPGRAAVQAHGELRSFAKEYGQAHPDVDQIYLKLDDAGKPVEVISKGQAGSLTKKGIKWTWVNNVWGSAKNLHTN